ncbi:MAG: PrgI family protein [Candidatus Kerfeldbacteria bacterium]|nr:PrgI family protein [Candidatus Kerfeldbacteria bacterium]
MHEIVPQFIDVEDKIIGPLSVRQFVTVLVTGGLVYLEYKIFGFLPFLLFGVVTAGVGITFTFVKVNGQPFHYVALSIIQTFKRPRLRVWKKSTVYVVPEKVEIAKSIYHTVPKPMVSTSRLRELALIVDTGGIPHHPFN